jgi:hypothetical protein
MHPDSTAVDDVTMRYPWWVQALDIITVAGALAGVALLLRTGPRFTIGSLFISLRSPWRPLACAAAAATLRHVLFRSPALHARLAAQVASLVRSRSLRAVLTPFLVSRAAVLLAAYLALLTVGYATDRPRPRFSDNAFLDLVTKWDGEWYYNIASDGYRWDDELRHRARLAFFPAYPMLMRGAGWAAGNLVVGGLIVSLVAFLWALTYLFRLAREDLDDEAARGAVALLAFYPFSIFYGVLYTESLFLLAAIGALHHFRRGEWAKASAWGLLVGLTRPNGFLLSAVLAAALAERVLRARREGRLDALEWRRVRVAVLVSSLPVVGAAIYSAFCWSLTGDPLIWVRLHEFWGRGTRTFLQMLGDRYRIVREHGLFGYVAAMPIDAVDICAGTFAVAAIWPVFRRLGPACALFVAINVVPPLLSGTTISLARLTSTLFPLFLWLAVVLRSERRTSVVGAFATLQGLFAVLFFTWRRFY